MSLVDKKIRLTPVQHVVLALVVSTAIAYFYKIASLNKKTIDLLLFKLRFDLLVLLVIFLISLLLSWFITYKLNYNTSRHYVKWEKKNPDAKLIFDQSLQEIYDEQEPKTRLYKFIVSVMGAFAVNYLVSFNYVQFGRVFSIVLILIFTLPMTYSLIFLNYTSFLGMSRRIYYQKGKIVIEARFAKTLKQPAGFNRKLEDFSNMQYSEKGGKYTLKIGAKRKLLIASSRNYDKINELRVWIEKFR